MEYAGLRPCSVERGLGVNSNICRTVLCQSGIFGLLPSKLIC